MLRVSRLFPFLLSGLFFFLFASGVFAFDLNGEWDADGMKLKAVHSGDSLQLLIDEPNIPARYQGIAELRGTISGNAFTGEEYTVHEDCPNLDGYRPASGTVTSRKIEITANFRTYDTDACTLDPNVVKVNTTYTKILSPEEKALDDYLNQQNNIQKDLADRLGPVVDLSNAAVKETTPITTNIFPVHPVAPEYLKRQAEIMNQIIGQSGFSPPDLSTEIARVVNFEGSITRHRTISDTTQDYQINKVGSSIKGNVLKIGDSFSFKGDGFLDYISLDGSVRRVMTAGWAKANGYGDQVQSGQTGIEIVLQPADPLPIPLPPETPPGPVQKFINWLGELLTPEPQPTPYGIVGVKG